MAVKRLRRPSATRPLSVATEHVGVDVSAAKQKDDAFAGQLGELPRKTRGERGRSGAFNDAFFQFDDAQNRERDLFFRDGESLIDTQARNLECVRSHLGNGESIREGWFPS